MAPNPRRQDAKLDALYAALPTFDCKGLCAKSCGPIGMSLRERRRIEPVHGDLYPTMPDATCSMLTPMGRCSCYELRPLICRLYGVCEGLECEWGCRPERLLTYEEAHDLMLQTATIGGHDPESAALVDALRSALE